MTGVRKLDSPITLKLSQVSNKLNAQSTFLLHEHSDLKLVEWRILRQLQALGMRTSMMNLAMDMQIDKGQLSRSIKEMAAKGLLSVDTDEGDNRTHLVGITELGNLSVEHVVGYSERRHRYLLSGISADDLNTFVRVLETIGEAADVREFPDPDIAESA